MGGDPIPRLHIALREWFEEATRRIRILGRPKEYTGDDDLTNPVESMFHDLRHRLNTFKDVCKRNLQLLVSMIQVHFGVQLIPEEGFAAFLSPATIPAPPCLRLCSSWLVSPRMTRVGGDANAKTL